MISETGNCSERPKFNSSCGCFNLLIWLNDFASSSPPPPVSGPPQKGRGSRSTCSPMPWGCHSPANPQGHGGGADGQDASQQVCVPTVSQTLSTMRQSELHSPGEAPSAWKVALNVTQIKTAVDGSWSEMSGKGWSIGINYCLLHGGGSHSHLHQICSGCECGGT